jgi:ubiquinone/menaquinone biosynthesis C-methylase UbiE
VIKFILKNYNKDSQGIFIGNFRVKSQFNEFVLRKKVASKNYGNYFNEISNHHSIEVMDNEVKIFLKKQKKNSIILDVGCGWCWHWRKLSKLRPDIKIIALDFVKENFIHAKNILGKKNLSQIYFVHEDFNNNKFPLNSFNAIWSCQTFQHMDKLSKKFQIVHNLLKNSSYFYNFNLNYSLFNYLRNFLKIKKQQKIKKFYLLNRDIFFQKKILNKIFKKNCELKYNEILFHPELNLYLGNKDSFISKLDSRLSGISIFKYFARQVLIKIKK